MERSNLIDSILLKVSSMFQGVRPSCGATPQSLGPLPPDGGGIKPPSDESALADHWASVDGRTEPDDTTDIRP